MEPVSQANPAPPAQLPSPSSSPRHGAPEGFFEESSCCSLNDDSCCGLFGWIKTAWDSFLEFFSCFLCCFCSRAPVSPEAPQQDPIRIDPIPADQDLADVAKVDLFLKKYRRSEGVINPTNDRGKAYLAEFDELPEDARDSAINKLCENWADDEAQAGFEVINEQHQDSRQTHKFNLLLHERLKNNLNHKLVRKALRAWVKSKNVN